MSSSQARGMTAGLEDALELARALAPRGAATPGPLSLDATANLDAALSHWERERLPVVHGYQERSRAVSARTGRRRPPRVLDPVTPSVPPLSSSTAQG